MSAKQSVGVPRTYSSTDCNQPHFSCKFGFICSKYNPVLSDFDDICDIKGVQSAAWILPKGSAYIAYYL